MKKLRIAVMVSGHFTTPPPTGVVYAPMDIAVEVVQGLAAKGHEITFFAPKGSSVAGAKVEDGGLDALKHDDGLPILKGLNVGGAESAKIFALWDQYLLALMFKGAREGRFDALFIHPIDRALPLSLAFQDVPAVYTMHDPVFPWRAEIFRLFASPNQYYVSISNAQRKPAPNLNYGATIYNGVKMDEFIYSAEHDNYLLFVGRINPDKGVAQAVQAARLAGERLLIIGPPATGKYWDEEIAPYLNDKIKYLGHVPREELFKYYQKAKAVLVPIQWEEPFGLVMTEGMACGTPVIAFRRGSVQEVVVEGKTGFIVDDVEQMVEAIKKIDTISRSACREHVKNNFSTDKMVDEYEELFMRLVK